jgi:hypothetical protein
MEFDVRQNLWFPSRSANSYGAQDKNSKEYERNTSAHIPACAQLGCKSNVFRIANETIDGNALGGANFGDVNFAGDGRAISLPA